MKKYIIFLFVLSTLASCEEITNSAENSKVTYLPLVEMQGESEYELECDATEFDDPGVTMTEGGEELEVEVFNKGTFFGGTVTQTAEGPHWEYVSAPIESPDAYEISYSAVNKDGIPGTAFRTVYWPICTGGDLSVSLEGMYSSSLVRTLLVGGGAAGTYTDVGPIMIKDLGNDVYQLSDMLGGWYVYGRALGYSYGAPGGTVTVNDMASNDFTHDIPVEVQTFGGAAEITDFEVDPVAGTIVYYVEWDAGYIFKVTLTQID